MAFFANLSIRSKLVSIIVLATMLALVAGFSVAIVTGVRQLRTDLMSTTETQARAAGQFSAVALAFDDKTEAERSLDALKAFDGIRFAVLYDLEGRPFVAYSRSGGDTPPTQSAVYGAWIDGKNVHCWQPVLFDGKRYGAIYVRASAESLASRIREYVWNSLLLGVVLLAISLGVAIYLQGIISRPLVELAEAATKVSRDNDYSLRVEKPGEDEIGTLYEGFNAMLEQIQRRQSELERSNRDLDQFAYVASHDLKAPLRAISTLAGWLEEDLMDRLSGDEREQLKLMRGRVRRMDNLIDGILQYSRVSRLEAQLEIVDVGALLRELVGDLAPPATVVVQILPEMPVLETRRLRLGQVFANLINNAIKYHDKKTTGGGTIRIGAVVRSHVVEFSVADNGPGIAAEHHQKIFQIFQTLQPRDKLESTGLGLALVSKLVDEEGGRVWLESELGQGSTFRFTWPARHPGVGGGTPPPSEGGRDGGSPRGGGDSGRGPAPDRPSSASRWPAFGTVATRPGGPSGSSAAGSRGASPEEARGESAVDDHPGRISSPGSRGTAPPRAFSPLSPSAGRGGQGGEGSPRSALPDEVRENGETARKIGADAADDAKLAAALREPPNRG